MASAWVHAVIDIIAYGRPYFDLHKEKVSRYCLSCQGFIVGIEGSSFDQHGSDDV